LIKLGGIREGIFGKGGQQLGRKRDNPKGEHCETQQTKMRLDNPRFKGVFSFRKIFYRNEKENFAIPQLVSQLPHEE